MKRSTKVFLGAMGLVTVAWGVEQAMKPKCAIGPDGKAIVTGDCRESSGSSSSRSGGGGGSWSSSQSHSTSTAPHIVSTGGWGSFGRSFSSGG